jgi:hypothetical protein
VPDEAAEQPEVERPMDDAAHVDATSAPALMDDAKDPLEDAWRSVVTRWDEPAAHKGFVFLAASLDRLTDAAKRYREAKNDGADVTVGGYRVPGNPASRKEIAERGLQLVLAQALARFDAIPREDRGRSTPVALPIAALMMLFALSFALANSTGNRVFISLPVLAVELLVVALFPWRKLRRS